MIHNDPPRTRTWNLRLRGPTPYPLGQRAPADPAMRWRHHVGRRGCQRRPRWLKGVASTSSSCVSLSRLVVVLIGGLLGVLAVVVMAVLVSLLDCHLSRADVPPSSLPWEISKKKKKVSRRCGVDTRAGCPPRQRGRGRSSTGAKRKIDPRAARSIFSLFAKTRHRRN